MIVMGVNPQIGLSLLAELAGWTDTVEVFQSK